MATISVPLSAELEHQLDGLVREGVGSSRADVMRRAFERFAEDSAVLAVVAAEQEMREGKVLRGNPRDVLLG